MDLGNITTIISQVGFPIACCIYLIYSNNQQDKRSAETIEKLRQAIDNNTKAMIELKSLLGVRHE